jgi:hypothetical protein
MYTIDTRYQLWLEECMTATSQSRVDNSILKFRSIIEQVRFGTFKLRLLSVFAAPTPAIKVTPTPKIDNKIEDPVDKKGNKEKNNKRFINKSPSEAFKLTQGETRGGSFANKNVNGPVTWKGKVKMCPC